VYAIIKTKEKGEVRTMKKAKIKKQVRKAYSEIAERSSSCCGSSPDTISKSSIESYNKRIGYSDEELKSIPEEASLGVGCGNPVALSSLKEGEVVLDLGSGAGFDAFLAAKAVGERGKVIGVDMTEEMIEKARENTKKGGYKNVEFRLGEIENLPVEDNSIDVVISNCVINLSPDKENVFKEVYRVLRTNGRMLNADIVVTKLLPESILQSIEAYVSCIAGADLKEEYLEKIKKAGFKEVKILSIAEAGGFLSESSCACDLTENIEESLKSIKVLAKK
jgi:ubiquinone/menaquinone biosynthesis C-methylase UbiE